MFPFDVDNFPEVSLVIPLQGLEMTTVSDPHFTSLEEDGDDYCIVKQDLSVFLEIAMNKAMPKQFSKGDVCAPRSCVGSPHQWLLSERWLLR